MYSVFGAVRAVGLEVPGVETATKYDGSPVLRVNGVFVAGAMQSSIVNIISVIRSRYDGGREDESRHPTTVAAQNGQ
jgi:hypothetical protein